MTVADDSFDTLPRMPSWVTSERLETFEDVAFLSGATLTHLHLVLNHSTVPHTLLRARLALRAAESCITRQGRPERTGELRDAIAFSHPGDSPGPAGETAESWLRAVSRPISVQALHRALPSVEAEQIADWFDAGKGAPIPRVAAALQAALVDRPRDQSTALLIADAVLAQSLNWEHVLPLLAFGLKRGDLPKAGKDLQLACHRGLIEAAIEAARKASDLARRVARLKEVAPKLRARGSEEALSLFLMRDAVAPTALTALRSDRAARRFCDRLVELGAVRELTGRDTFRLYGV